MKQFGLIGYPLSHSFSPAYFKQKFKLLNLHDYEFNLFELKSLDELKSLPLCDLSGLTVTIPFKEKILSYVDFASQEVKEIGAANCLKISTQNNKTSIFAYNTDVIGFEKSLLGFIGNERPDALILGTGGAAKAVAFVLKNLNIKYKFVSRTKKENQLVYGELTNDLISKSHLIVNTTPVGMHPNSSKFPDLPYSSLGKNHFLFDLIYNPQPTEFLKRGMDQGCKCIDGTEMLHFQADAAWEIWTNNDFK